jgi:hypothetical protein
MNTSDERQAGPGGAPYWLAVGTIASTAYLPEGYGRYAVSTGVCGSSGPRWFLAR